MTAVKYQAKGWPDLTLCHEERGALLFRELKVPPNKLSPEQAAWLERLRAAGNDAALWVPADWPEIVDVLTFGTQVPS